MIKKVLVILAVTGLSITMVFAQESGQDKQGPRISEWLKTIQHKIAQLVPKKSVQTSTSVAGVRGAKQDSQAKLYWKGKSGDEPVTEDELAKFKKGIDLAAQGNASGAAGELQEFMKQHPDSALIPDAKKTLDLVRAEPPKTGDKKEVQPEK